MILTEKIEQDNLKLIRLENNQFVIVDLKAVIKVNDVIADKYRVWYWRDDCSLLGRHKVIFATSDLNLEGVNIIEEKKEYYLNGKGFNIGDEVCLFIGQKGLHRGFVYFGEFDAEIFTCYGLYVGDINGKQVSEAGLTDEYTIISNKQTQQELYTKEQVEEAIKISQTISPSEDPYTILSEFEFLTKEEIFEKLKQVKVEVDLLTNKAKFI